MTLLFLVCGWTTTADSESLKSSAARVFSGDSSLESGSAARRRTGANLGAISGMDGVADDGERKRGRSNNFSSDGDYDDDAEEEWTANAKNNCKRCGSHRKRFAR